MAYIKEHYQHPDAVFLKEALKFKQGRDVYGKLTFGYSSVFEGATRCISVYNKEMEKFFAANFPPYAKGAANDLIFIQETVQFSHYFHAPPITRYPHGDAIKLPDSETKAEPIYADVLQHIQQHHSRHPRMQRQRTQTLGSHAIPIQVQSPNRRFHHPPQRLDRR